ncbi:MAG TPA: FAD-dependent monooxygenase [Amycolatopsis sp.]|uniref:FAD-dependent monooxygenase n=1 Tax=Amycolatopsis sp. TaxID=37632 RepID=UPI002B4A7DA3|nr:FAD-dependent monooxygenase [Amycolatopsis sp.]HKS47283.1 FAD-dependent monooxygenase [Amycolatopsis sp.]
MRNKTVLISGASIAGPATAFWLNRYGFTTTVVERAPELGKGGQAVDFRGAQVEVLRRMGLLEEVRRNQTAMGEQRILDADGRHVFSLPSSFAAGEVEIQRGDLSRILYEATKDRTEYVFGDRITSLTETGEGVRVTFAHGAPRTFDLVVGADGLHSGVRTLAFGPEEKFRKDMGYSFAGFTAPNHLKLDHVGLMYNLPGRGVMVASHRNGAEATVGLVFATDMREVDRRDIKKFLAELYRGIGWEVPKLIEAMWRADDLFFSPLCQMHLEHYTRGRIALVGDAGWGAGPGGSGTGMAMAAAYVLAGELAEAGGDHRVAFPRYEREVRPGAEAGLKQAKNTGPFLAPKTAKGIWLRNQMHRLLASKMMVAQLDKMALKAANVLAPSDYVVATNETASSRDMEAPRPKAAS